MSKKGRTVCGSETMSGYNESLKEIEGLLMEIEEKASELPQLFVGAYEGRAQEEVLLFLVNFPKHMGRLRVLYEKLDEFIQVTAESFFQSDNKMAKKVGE